MATQTAAFPCSSLNKLTLVNIFDLSVVRATVVASKAVLLYYEYYFVISKTSSNMKNFFGKSVMLLVIR